MPPEMTTKCATLGETFLANIALVRFLAGMSSLMLNQIPPGAVRLATELTDLRLIAGVYSRVNLYVLSCDQLAAHFARHLTLAGVCPHVLLVAISVKCLKAADLAFELLPHFGLTVKLHVIPQINTIAKGLVTDLAGARLLIGVHAHVQPQGSLQIETFVTNPAELRELLIVSPDMDVQTILRRQFRTAHMTNVRRVMGHLMHFQISPLFEDLLAFVAFYRLRFVADFQISLDSRNRVFRFALL